MIIIRFQQGSLEVDGPADETGRLAEWLSPGRVRGWVASARHYRNIILECRRVKIEVRDLARSYGLLEISQELRMQLRPHQSEAFSAWEGDGSHGVVSMPTGAGKTVLALFAMQHVKRATLVVVPTIDLMRQWREVITKHLGVPVGCYGGGEHELADVTVATYDSARLIIERFGDRFGFLIVDECHHLPATHNQVIAEACIAPFRLGLSATVERADGGEERLFELLGPLAYEANIPDLAEGMLAPYDTVTCQVRMTDSERTSYLRDRGIYTQFLRKSGISLQSRDGWQRFIQTCARTAEGREAFKAFQRQKKTAQAASAKLDQLWSIMSSHVGEWIIVFTDQNDMAYQIGREFVLPVLTHKTSTTERKQMLAAFSRGELRVMVTTRVLNEGIDVPEASVGIVVSGSGAVREHVQRLGRILRHREDKRAVLYEIVTADSGEIHTQSRRRMHIAYQRPG